MYDGLVQRPINDFSSSLFVSLDFHCREPSLVQKWQTTLKKDRMQLLQFHDNNNNNNNNNNNDDDNDNTNLYS